MKTFISLILTLAALVATVDCSDDLQPPPPVVYQGQEPTPGPEPKPEVKILINGETPKAYYSHFLFERASYCPAPWYKYAGTFTIDLGKDELDRTLHADIKIMMFSDGTYYGYYQEQSLGDVGHFGRPILQVLNQRFKRRWKIEGAEIVFEDLGRGYAMMVNKRRTIQLQVERDIIRLGLQGRVVEIVSLNSNYMVIKDLDNCRN